MKLKEFIGLNLMCMAWFWVAVFGFFLVEGFNTTLSTFNFIMWSLMALYWTLQAVKTGNLGWFFAK